MKRVSIFLLLAFCLVSISAIAQEGRGPGGGRHMPSVDDQVSQLKQAVNLNDDQAAKVHDILQAQRDKMREMMQDSSVSREDRHAKMQSLRKDSNDQIRALLTDDQKKSFDSYMQQRREERRQGNGESAPQGPQ